MSALLPAARATADTCTGWVVGRLVLGYGDHGPVSGEWITIDGAAESSGGPAGLLQTAADGTFRIEGVSLGWHNAAARHAQFAFYVPSCGQTVDVGTVPYPLFHPAVPPVPTGPSHPAARALLRFMDARIARDDRAVEGMLTGRMLSRANVVDGVLFQVSNPCWYRYEVISSVEWTSNTPDQPPLDGDQN